MPQNFSPGGLFARMYRISTNMHLETYILNLSVIQGYVWKYLSPVGVHYDQKYVPKEIVISLLPRVTQVKIGP